MKQSTTRFTLIETRGEDLAHLFARCVREGLTKRPKTLPPKFFYDERGSRLFEQICHLPEYYLPRLETEILCQHVLDVERLFPQEVSILEFGSGNSTKTRLLLEVFLQKRANLLYLPIDISREMLVESSESLLGAYPNLRIIAYLSEYDKAWRAMDCKSGGAKLFLFLGSSIGNFNMQEARRFFQTVRKKMSSADRFLIGFDMQKEVGLMHAAYNDAEGVTAQFNLNLLERINRELGGGFALENFQHRAFYNEQEGRIEMHLVSLCEQKVNLRALDETIVFEEGETLHTENSYKFTREQVEQLASQSGFAVEQRWTDKDGWFSLALFSPSA